MKRREIIYKPYHNIEEKESLIKEHDIRDGK